MSEELPPEYVVPPEDVLSYFTIYDPLTGKINRVGGCRTGDLALQLREGEALVPEASNGLTQYVLADEIVDRPEFTISKTEIAADDVDEAVLSGLPDPVTVTLDGEEHEVTGGTLSIASAMPATYVVEINHWPWMPFRVEVIAS